VLGRGCAGAVVRVHGPVDLAHTASAAQWPGYSGALPARTRIRDGGHGRCRELEQTKEKLTTELMEGTSSMGVGQRGREARRGGRQLRRGHGERHCRCRLMRRSSVAESSCLCGLDGGGNEAEGGRSTGSSELKPSSAMAVAAADGGAVWWEREQRGLSCRDCQQWRPTWCTRDQRGEGGWEDHGAHARTDRGKGAAAAWLGPHKPGRAVGLVHGDPAMADG
jgi:hypothetical protein